MTAASNAPNKVWKVIKKGNKYIWVLVDKRQGGLR